MVCLLRRRYRLMGMLLCWHGVCGRVAVLWPHLLWIPQYSGGEVGRMHHHWRLHVLLTVHPNGVTAAAAVLFCYRKEFIKCICRGGAKENQCSLLTNTHR